MIWISHKPNSSLVDGFTEILGAGVSFQLISATHALTDSQGKVGKWVFLERWLTSLPPVCAGEYVFQVSFTWEDNFGFPGAFFIRNNHTTEFFLKSLTLEDVPGFGRVHFDCNSLVYPFGRYKRDRIFFANSTYLPNETPNPLRKYREEELLNLRGDWIIGERRKWDRIYGYDAYNDLVDPYGGVIRPILGGCEYPYPRCGRTWGPRPRRGGFLVPLDAFRNLTQGFTPPMFQDELLTRDGESFLKFPPPQVLREDMFAWRTDEEFTRGILAGVNPLIIRRLKEFPPLSKLDPQIYGDQNSKITEEDIKYGLEGLSVHQAINQNKLFILDHHDALMPYLRNINSTSTKTYATRTLLFLKADGILRPLVIELSLPHPQGDQFGVNSKLYFPAQGGVENSIWQLAKTYVSVNDAGYHQLISHWLNLHAIQKHFVIATHRHLSVLHPIHKLLVPHYKDTMFINAFARQVLVNTDSLLESTHFQSKYAMELSSHVYKEWNFLEQALPANLIKRGVAVEDASSPHGLRLLIEDYPFAVDGLEIWSTIKTWVTNYCSLYYKSDMAIQNDIELQSWWKEAREKGHVDKKNEPWWPKMQTFDELVETCTIIIWTSSTLLAADNFGQYPYGGYVPNKPTISRRLMAIAGSAEYKELESKLEKAFVRTTNSQLHIPLGVSLIEILSRQAYDEVYLGQRASIEWTSDKAALEAFENFWREVLEVENRIIERNKYVYLKNRTRPANMSYMLRPSSAEGLTKRGIPNRISILSRL